MPQYTKGNTESGGTWDRDRTREGETVKASSNTTASGTTAGGKTATRNRNATRKATGGGSR